MRIHLDQIEARLQAIIEGGAARLLTPGNHSPNLGEHLIAVMKANLDPQSNGVVWAPSLYTLAASPSRAAELRANQPLLDELLQLILTTGEEAGLKFASYPVINITPNDQISSEEIRMYAQHRVEKLVETKAMSVEAGLSKENQGSNAFLIINGDEIFPLKGGVINVGRNSENQLSIKDPHISRFHAQIRLVKGRYMIFDLDSTGGTFVNGQRISQCELLPGDVIYLANTSIIFGVEDDRSSSETQEYNPD